MAIITRDERLLSPSRFLNLVLISFISEKFLSTDAVPTGIDRTKCSDLETSISLETSCVSCSCKSSFGCLDM